MTDVATRTVRIVAVVGLFSLSAGTAAATLPTDELLDQLQERAFLYF